MSLVQALISGVFGLFFAVLILLRIASAREKRRALSELPPNTSGGTPVVSVRRERVIAGLFIVFVLCIMLWLLLSKT